MITSFVWITSFPAPFIEEINLSPFYVFGSSVKGPLNICVQLFLGSIFSSIFYMCILKSVTTVFISKRLKYSFQSRIVMPKFLFFFYILLKMALVLWVICGFTWME